MDSTVSSDELGPAREVPRTYPLHEWIRDCFALILCAIAFVIFWTIEKIESDRP